MAMFKSLDFLQSSVFAADIPTPHDTGTSRVGTGTDTPELSHPVFFYLVCLPPHRAWRSSSTNRKPLETNNEGKGRKVKVDNW